MTMMIAHVHPGCPARPIRARSEGVPRLLGRYRVDYGACLLRAQWSQHQAHHPLDVDHQPGQQILDAAARAATIARPAPVVPPDDLGQFAFDGRMLAAHRAIEGGSAFWRAAVYSAA